VQPLRFGLAADALFLSPQLRCELGAEVFGLEPLGLGLQRLYQYVE